MMNPKQHIDQLLDRYFAGTTTLQEEETLKAYFRTEEVAMEHLPWQEYFLFLHSEAEVQLSENFSERLLAQLTEENQEYTLPTTAPQQGRPIALWVRMSAIAALFILGLTLVPKLWDAASQTQSTAEIDWEAMATQDEEIAFEEAKAALLLLSSKLNGGTEKAAGQLKKVKKATKISH